MLVITMHQQKKAEELTRVSLPVKVVFRVAVALQVQPKLLTSRAVGKGDVVVANLVEEMDLLLLQEKSRSDRVDWCIAPTFIEEATSVVERLEVVNVFLGPQPFQTSNLKVGPLQAG